MQHVDLRVGGCPPRGKTKKNTKQKKTGRGWFLGDGVVALSFGGFPRGQVRCPLPGFWAPPHEGSLEMTPLPPAPSSMYACACACSISCVVACSSYSWFVLARHVASCSLSIVFVSSVASPSCVFVAARAPDSKVVLWLFRGIHFGSNPYRGFFGRCCFSPYGVAP